MSITTDSVNSLYPMQLVDEQIKLVCRIIDRELISKSEICNELVDHYKSKRGKMIRPRLLLLAAGACGEIKKEHLLSAAIFEMIHNATLLHDDVIDCGMLRRNIPTVNSLWGNKAAILLGDIFLSHALKASSNLEQQIITIISDTMLETCEGEVMQDFNPNEKSISEDEYIQIIKMKSAAMFGSCCYLGAVLNHSEVNVCERLKRYGILTGMAYQISDDIADIYSNDNQLGKSSWRDIETQITTLPIIHLLSQGYEYVKLKTMSRSDIIELLSERESISYCHGYIRQYCLQAMDELACLPESEYKTALKTLTKSISL